MNAVTDAIVQRVSDPNVRAAMLMGSYLESGWNPLSVGDQNSSFGPFQIHLPAHPGVTIQQAEDPQFAVAFMEPSYEAGVSSVAPSLWQTNPALAAATAAYKAERPSVMYPAARYAAAWPKVQAVLGGNTTLGSTGTAPGSTSSPGTGTATATDTGLVSSTITGPLNLVWMSGIIVAGAVILGIGLYLLITGTPPSAPVINITVPKEKNGSQTRTPPIQRSAPNPRPIRASAVRTDARPTVKATAGRPQPPRPIIINPRGVTA